VGGVNGSCFGTGDENTEGGGATETLMGTSESSFLKQAKQLRKFSLKGLGTNHEKTASNPGIVGKISTTMDQEGEERSDAVNLLKSAGICEK